MWRWLLLIPCAAATALAVFIGWRIEVYNAEMPGYLGPGEVGEWRKLPTVLPPGAMGKCIYTKEEGDRMARNDEFLRYVATWGRGQYRLAPAALAFAVILTFMRWRPERRGRPAPTILARVFAPGRVLAALLAATALACIVLAFHRDYLGSLGWHLLE